MATRAGPNEPSQQTGEAEGSAQAFRIFISYRRDDAPDAAGRLYDRLTEDFHAGVFMDVDDIPPGVDFVEAIDSAVGKCDALIAVVGKKWLTARDNVRRQRRLDNPDDFVRLEIQAALRRPDVLVIPLLVHGAQMPSSLELPDDLKPFARRNGVSVTHSNWAGDVGSLVHSLQELADRKRAAQQALEAEERRRSEGRRQREQHAGLSDAEEQARRHDEEQARRQAEEQNRIDAKDSRWGGDRKWAAKLLTALAAAIIVLALVAFTLLPGDDGGDGTSQVVTKTVRVEGKQVWTDTGIHLSEGDMLEIEANGRVLHDSKNPATSVDPDGAGAGVDPGLNTVGKGVYVYPPGHGGLVARLDSEAKVFGVGAKWHDKVRGNGRLQLGINDYNGGKVEGGVANNSGAFNVAIKVTRNG